MAPGYWVLEKIETCIRTGQSLLLNSSYTMDTHKHNGRKAGLLFTPRTGYLAELNPLEERLIGAPPPFFNCRKSLGIKNNMILEG